MLKIWISIFFKILEVKENEDADWGFVGVFDVDGPVRRCPEDEQETVVLPNSQLWNDRLFRAHDLEGNLIYRGTSSVVAFINACS